MTHVITSLCLRDNSCADVCPVECISLGETIYVIDAKSCIDCGACVPECPYNAIFPEDEVPTAYRAKGDEFINQVGLINSYQYVNHSGEKIILKSVRQLTKGEVVDLTRAR